MSDFENVSGTPGVGKSSLAGEVADRCGLELIQVSELAREKDCFDGFDEELQCPILDEDKVGCGWYNYIFLIE